MKTDRREFLRSSAKISLGFLGLYTLSMAGTGCVGRSASSTEPAAHGRYGPLIPDPEKILNLPKGFTYRIISRSGVPMRDGFFVPAKPDGMAAFSGGADRTIIIRNHENSPEDLEDGPFGKNNQLLSRIDKAKVYDYGSGKIPGTGGTTTMVYNHGTGKIEYEYLSLAGTIRNCAGGPTPWNAWLSCEETVAKANGTLEKDHGYVFEVPASASVALADPVPLKGLGRFNHEAVAVDPNTGIVYLTEDDGEGLIYRFIPNTPGQLIKGGKLQALALADQASFDTRNWEDAAGATMALRKFYPARWVDLDNIESPDGDLRLRGFTLGAARFARGEGMWYGRNEIYFACTSGGRNKSGQIFRYRPGAYEGTAREKEMPGQLELFAEPNDTDILKSCDNLTVAPWGDVVLCEDDKHPFLVGVTPQGAYYKLAENVGYKSEFAGAVFSPDGRTLFVNIQGAGLTVAIEGKW